MLNVVLVSNLPYWRGQIIEQILNSTHTLSGILIPEISQKKSYSFLLKILCHIPYGENLADFLKRGLNSEILNLYKLTLRHNISIDKVADTNQPQILNKIRSQKPDVILTLAWPRKFSKELLEIPKVCCVNCHPSLLPKFRGRYPITAAILANEAKSGITYHKMNEHFDMGDILYKEEIQVAPDETGLTLLNKSGEAFRKSIVPFLDKLESGELGLIPQNRKKGSNAPNFTQKDALIIWNKSTDEIDLKIRALYPWFRAYTYHCEQKINVLAYEKLNCSKETDPGKIMQISQDGILVATSESSLLIKSFLLPGLSKQQTNQYIKSRIKIGDLLGHLDSKT